MNKLLLCFHSTNSLPFSSDTTDSTQYPGRSAQIRHGPRSNLYPTEPHLSGLTISEAHKHLPTPLSHHPTMSTTGSFNAKNPTIKRILKEASELSHLPTTDYAAAPLESNFFEWHFTLRGPPSPSPYASGLYHGRIILPPTYPLRPPSFRFLTPSGRFEPNREICLSISGHHEESWQPAWGIRTALVAIRAFMESEAKGQVGGVDASVEARMRYARESRGWKCPGCGGRSCEDIMKDREKDVEDSGANGDNVETGETVPEELKLGYREELGKGGEKLSSNDGGAVRKLQAASHATEDFSAPASRSDSAGAAVVESRISRHTEKGPVVSDVRPAPLPSPTRTTAPHQSVQRRPQPRDSSNRLDIAIAVLAVALALMLMRKLAYYL